MSRNNCRSFKNLHSLKKFQNSKSKDVYFEYKLMPTSSLKPEINTTIKLIGLSRVAATKFIGTSTVHSISPPQNPVLKYPSKLNQYPFHLMKPQALISSNSKFPNFPKGTHTNSTGSLNNKGNSVSENNTNNYIINTLNVSTKNLIGNSLDYSDPYEYELKCTRIQKENEGFKIKLKEQDKLITGLETKNKILEQKYAQITDAHKKLQSKYKGIKESENQLLSILYVIDESGVDVDSIIENYNKSNQLNSEAHPSTDSNRYTPITLEHSIKPLPLSNIPMLNFSKINQNEKVNISLAEKKNNNKINHLEVSSDNEEDDSSNPFKNNKNYGNKKKNILLKLK